MTEADQFLLFRRAQMNLNVNYIVVTFNWVTNDFSFLFLFYATCVNKAANACQQRAISYL